jgi:hypothetical protein
MSNAPDPKVFSVVQRYTVAESMEDARTSLGDGTPLWDRAEAEEMLTSFEFSTGKRHYIFALDIRIQQVTA